MAPAVTLVHRDAPAEAETMTAWELAVLTELRAIRAALEQQQQRQVSTLSRADRATLERLLPAVAGAYGPETFSARDLADDDRPAVRIVVQGLSVKRLGKLLARADGVATIAGLTLQRCGVECQATTWRIVRADGFK
jgi:hypothetical protein